MFQTRKTRREATVHNLLQKIPADMIVLDPHAIGTIQTNDKEEHLKLQKEAFAVNIIPPMFIVSSAFFVSNNFFSLFLFFLLFFSDF